MLVLEKIHPKCPRIPIIVGTQKILALLDTGASNNFIARQTVKRCSVKILQTKAKDKIQKTIRL